MTRRRRSTIAANLDSIHLAFGSHASREDGMCLMEAVAYVAGEPHTDRPKCVCPVLAAFGRAWNDSLSDEDRQRLLRPFVPRLVGTRSTPEVEQRRAFMAADWAVRVAAPVWLRVAGLNDAAGSLEALAPLDSVEACRSAASTIAQAREAAAAAATAAAAAAVDAVGDAAWVAAWAAARDAAGAAAVDAARAAGVLAAGAAVVFGAKTAAADAAMAAGVDAARDAAWAVAAYATGAVSGDAAGDAAWAVLRPHVERLQASAVGLYERMIEVRP